MSLHPAQLLRLLEPAVRPGTGGGGAARGEAAAPFERQSFAQLLRLVSRGDVRSERPVQASGDAKTLAPLSSQQLDRLAAAADAAEAAGARRTLMLIDGRGVVVDIAKRAVIDELNDKSAARSVSVDAAVHVASAEKPVPAPLKPPEGGLAQGRVKSRPARAAKATTHRQGAPGREQPASVRNEPVRKDATRQAAQPRSATAAPASTATVGESMSPVAPALIPVRTTLEGRALDAPLVLNNQSNVSLRDRSVNGVEHGIMVDNGQRSENIEIDGFTATNVSRYGMYLGEVDNWRLSNVHLQQGEGASEHGLRIADGRNLSLRAIDIDTTLGHKSALWLLNVADVTIEDLHTRGGAIRLGAPPNANLGAPTASNVVIRDARIEKVSGGDMEAICVWPGAQNVHFANLDITLTTGEHWLSIDERNVSGITWENVRVNGKVVTGYEGVKLGGLSEAEALARGIGPAAAPLEQAAA